MEESESVEPANTTDACAGRIENLWRDVRSCRFDPQHRENSGREPSPRRCWNSRLCSANGHRGAALLEVSRNGEIRDRGTCRGASGRRGQESLEWFEEIFCAGK